MRSMRARMMALAALVAIAPVVLILASAFVDNGIAYYLSRRVSGIIARWSAILRMGETA